LFCLDVLNYNCIKSQRLVLSANTNLQSVAN